MMERSDPAPAPERRRYEAPKILETAHFETLALACNKAAGPPDRCDYYSPPAGAS